MPARQPPEPAAPLRPPAQHLTQTLRQRAEQSLGGHSPAVPAAADLSPYETARQLHELQVHQIELEMQNDELHRMQQALEVSRASYADLYDQAPVGYVSVGDRGLITHANLRAASLLGVSPDLLKQQLLSHFIFRDDQDVYYMLRKLALANHRTQTQELRLVNATGGHFWAELAVICAPGNGNAPELRVMLSDVSERHAAQQKTALAASVFSQAREGIMITDTSGKIVDVNDAFSRITGYSRDEIVGQNPRMLSSGRQPKTFYAAMWRDLLTKGHWYGEVWNRRKNGEVYAELQTVTSTCNAQGVPTHFVALFSDITSFKAQQTQLEHIAHYDLLTDLPNRMLLADRLHQSMAQAVRRGDLLGVVYLDLDCFKSVNDKFGHEVGDQLLQGLAARMKDTMREGDTLARIGGDEFVAVLTDLADVSACLPMLKRLLGAANQPIEVAELTLQVSASLGVTFYPQQDISEADQLLRQADQAMYLAKQSGKNRYHLFDAAHDRLQRGQHDSLTRIRLALVQQELVLYYQPKVNMHSGAVIGAEALIRWQHPQQGLLMPAEFLPVIETDALAIEVGEWVIDTALAQVAQWQAQGLHLPVSVNVGALQLQQPNFVARLRSLMQRYPGITPNLLTLEMLETSALQDMDYAAQVIEDCRQMGVAFALDDFGTGYSSLIYLKRLRVALLKIDQSFVRDMLIDPDDLSILRGVIGLAAAFHREVIAEGVETVAHGTLLLQLGCELAQGYGIARPMPAALMPAWAASWQPNAVWRSAPDPASAAQST